ncbi:uncharacterized WD repeat-containing protein all2124 [Phtheirospermum japonicum]|uniref:Uncharacterized WD repeat-containing protein all2124 n=1 Tax=Phtheirospermum japonicum TaxID=374723 RepID=A0A830CK32_9LAMI|nr:uncharacterized WD repeat-containing protein all2124 [Phtheirospermum japonicum]
MGKFLHFSSPFNSINSQISDQPEFSLSSDSSLASQPSLPSVPSLEQPAAAADPHCSATLKSHSYVFSLAIAGEHLYCGDADGKIAVCDRNLISPENYNSTPVAISSTAVKSIVISGDKIFAAHQDNKIRVWKIDDNSTSQQKYRKITVLPTLSDRCARLFSAENYVKVRRHKKRTWIHHNDAVSALAITNNGSLLYSVSWDRTFKVWRTSDFKCLESVQNAHDDAINAVVLSADGFVYTGSADRTIKVWRKNDVVEKHTLISTLEKHISAVNALALSADGSVLYSGACDRSIIVWEKEGGASHMTVAGALRGHTKAILCLAVVNDLLFSGSADKTVRVWRRSGESGNSYSCLAVFEGHRNPIKCLTACLDSDNSNRADSYVVYSGSLDCEIKVWRFWVPFGI